MPDSFPPLLPCPFCGGEAERVSTAGYHYVRCSRSGCAAGPALPYANTVTEADSAWNTRAIPHVLASVDGVVRWSGEGENGLAYIELRQASGTYMADDWLYSEVDALQLDGKVENGQPVRITLTAEPCPSCLPEPEDTSGAEWEDRP